MNRKMINRRLIYHFFGFIFLVVAACATTQSGTISSGNPEKLVSQLKTNLETAKGNQVNVLAPELYNDARDAFLKASAALKQGGKLADITKYVAEGEDSLKQAEEIAQVARVILDKTNEARKKALDAGAEELGSPYTAVEDQYLRLTRAIENDNLSYAQKNAAAVQTAFNNIEIMAIKNNVLGNVRKIMAEANDAKLQKLVPSAYNDALSALNEADAYVDQNPYEVEGIRRKAIDAELMARRLFAMHESAEKFQEMEPEEAALYLEGLMTRLGSALKTDDLRDRVTSAQLIALTDAATTTIQQRQSIEINTMNAEKRISELEEELDGLKGFSRQQAMAREDLEAEREFNERFDKIQRYFNADEAEVYKQGNQLIIRLRGIQFPVGQAILSPENYLLLSKVQRAISEFGQPMITIEGHTDSTGSIQTNLQLSQQRAEAVKTYLIANKTLPESRIQATGYGPNRPLAPNTTAENRAINRRIDIVITPDMLGGGTP